MSSVVRLMIIIALVVGAFVTTITIANETNNKNIVSFETINVKFVGSLKENNITYYFLKKENDINLIKTKFRFSEDALKSGIVEAYEISYNYDNSPAILKLLFSKVLVEPNDNGYYTDTVFTKPEINNDKDDIQIKNIIKNTENSSNNKKILYSENSLSKHVNEKNDITKSDENIKNLNNELLERLKKTYPEKLATEMIDYELEMLEMRSINKQGSKT